MIQILGSIYKAPIKSQEISLYGWSLNPVVGGLLESKSKICSSASICSWQKIIFLQNRVFNFGIMVNNFSLTYEPLMPPLYRNQSKQLTGLYIKGKLVVDVLKLFSSALSFTEVKRKDICTETGIPEGSNLIQISHQNMMSKIITKMSLSFFY